jgi:hypothetical protein
VQSVVDENLSDTCEVSVYNPYVDRYLSIQNGLSVLGDDAVVEIGVTGSTGNYTIYKNGSSISTTSVQLNPGDDFAIEVHSLPSDSPSLVISNSGMSAEI